MKAKIRFAFRIVIDKNSRWLWDRYVLEDSFAEYKLQHQRYDNPESPVNTYWEVLEKNSNATAIPFVIGASIEGYVNQLNGVLKSVPDLLGDTFFPFVNYKLDIIHTDITDISKHKIGITFYSPTMWLIDQIDKHYLVSFQTDKDNAIETHMFPFHKQMAICYYEVVIPVK